MELHGRNIIRRARKRAPEGVVAVCGCYAQTDPKAVGRLGADLVSGSAGRLAFLDRLEELLKAKGEQVVCVDSALSRRDFEQPVASAQQLPLHGLGFHLVHLAAQGVDGDIHRSSP